MIELHSPVAYMNGDRIFEVELWATRDTAWRTARVRSLTPTDGARIDLGYADKLINRVFGTDVIDDLTGDWRLKSASLRMRSLPEWRREVGPQSFQDAHLETVLKWLAATVDGALDLNIKGKPLRHYQVRKGPAHQAVREALFAWRAEATLLELDNGKLHIGPERETPHFKAKPQARLVQKVNLFNLSVVGNGRYHVEIPGMAWLRVGHRVEIKHELLTDTVLITEVRHRWAGSAWSWLEVMELQ